MRWEGFAAWGDDEVPRERHVLEAARVLSASSPLRASLDCRFLDLQRR
jgi:hypothetical protein